MSFPDPRPGLVIRYAYLWKREHDAGREEGSKGRPCAIVLSILDGTAALGKISPALLGRSSPDGLQGSAQDSGSF
ncbi:MAG: hypothetical protein ACRETZ_02760 [Steroidobacteraceae bacterium]